MVWLVFGCLNSVRFVGSQIVLRIKYRIIYLFIIIYYLFIYYCDSVIVLQQSQKITNHKSYTRSVSKYALAVISYEAGRHFILNLISHTCHTLDRLPKRPAGLPFSRRLSQSDLYVLKTWTVKGRERYECDTCTC